MTTPNANPPHTEAEEAAADRDPAAIAAELAYRAAARAADLASLDERKARAAHHEARAKREELDRAAQAAAIHADQTRAAAIIRHRASLTPAQ